MIPILHWGLKTRVSKSFFPMMRTRSVLIGEEACTVAANGSVIGERPDCISHEGSVMAELLYEFGAGV